MIGMTRMSLCKLSGNIVIIFCLQLSTLYTLLQVAFSFSQQGDPTGFRRDTTGRFRKDMNYIAVNIMFTEIYREVLSCTIWFEEGKCSTQIGRMMLKRTPSLILLLCVLIGLVSAANNVTQYRQQVNQIFDAALGSNVAYERLTYLCTNFNSRISGSSILESAIDWIVKQLQTDGFDYVTTEPVSVPNVSKARNSCHNMFCPHDVTRSTVGSKCRALDDDFPSSEEFGSDRVGKFSGHSPRGDLSPRVGVSSFRRPWFHVGDLTLVL